MLLQGKNAVITGGANGIGFATAEEFLKNGVEKVLLMDLGATLDPTKETQLKAHNPEALIFYAQCDITNKQQLEKVLRQDAIQWMSSIDILVNCAGIFNESDPEKCIATNLCALINVSMICIDLMSKENTGNGGTIVNISSVSGLEPFARGAVYSATKHGIIGFTRSMGTEITLNKTGVKIMAVCPGSTATDLYSTLKSTFMGFSWPGRNSIKRMETFEPQSANVVGRAVVKAIAEGEIASVWVAKDDKIRKVKFEGIKYV